MKRVLMFILILLFSVPAFAQRLADPKTITTASSSCTSASCVEVQMRGVLSVGISVNGAGTYTLEVEASKNDGTTWYAHNIVDELDPDSLLQEITDTMVEAGGDAGGNYSAVNSGITHLRVRASVLSGGTPVVSLTRGSLAPLTAIAAGGGGGVAGTEYDEGDTDSTITGSAMLMEDSNILRPIQGTVADGLLVNLGLNNDVTVTGSVTANAGTNLNTSLLALETGGNLAASAASLTLLDNVVGAASGGTAGTASLLSGGIYNASPPTLTDGQQVSMQFDVNGNLKTTLVGSIEANLEVGAQPADDPHYVRCSDGAVAAPCQVTGTVDLGATDNAVLDEIAASLALLDNAISGTEFQVDVLTMPTVTVTATNLDVQSGGADLATSTQAASIVTAVELLDNAISGAGFNITQLGSAAIPMTTTQADNLALSLDGLNVTAFMYMHDGTNYDMVRGDTTNGLLVNLGANNDVTVSATNLDVQIGGSDSLTIGTFPDNEPFNVAQINGVTVLMGNGATGTGSQRVTLANDNTIPTGWPTAANQTTLIGHVDGLEGFLDGVETSLAIIDNVVFGAGTAAAALRTTSASDDPAVTHLSQIETAIEALQTDVATANTIVRKISAGVTEDEFQVKATPGVLAFAICRNSHTTNDAYLKFTNATAASTTPGTTAVFLDILIPAGASGNNATPIEAAFDTALTGYIVLGKADNANDEVAANDVSCHVGYR